MPGLSRLTLIASLLAVTSNGAASGENLACEDAQDVVLEKVLNAPETFSGKCVRLRGVMHAAGKIGVALSDEDILDEKSRIISLYFDGDEPADLQSRPRRFEIVGRVLRCDQIWKHAEEVADRANRKQANNSEVHLGMVFGTCHYKDDAFAILISSDRDLSE